MRLVAVPADADAGVVFGAQHLRDLRRRPAERLDLTDDRPQPFRNRIGVLQTSQAVIVAKPERRYPPLAFVLAELKRLQRQRRDAGDQVALGLRRDEFSCVTQSLGLERRWCKKRKLLGQAGGPFSNALIGLNMGLPR